MYICSCHAVTDGAMRALIRSGKVRTFAQMAKTTGLATQCGICGRQAKELFYKILNEEIAAGNISATANAGKTADAPTVDASAPAKSDSACPRSCASCTCVGCPDKAVAPTGES
jgi:bacterioferritin-associated ferredoxin